MIHPLLDANGLPDVSRLDEWTATCDTCPSTTALARTTPWFIGRRDTTWCPACWRAVCDRLLHQALRPDGARGVLADLHYLPTRARLTATRTRHRLTHQLAGVFTGRTRPAR
ncbi:hypothetical protein [Actinomadura rupiterrae]|uniref:hypothetical protein n=1 Tax=Actinomadura rupiterrae TaxID=559627 RepID=UPI0020A607E6|nr:hypothetical protein [Actinomadura rupiterrae]MCP2337899.1 hypothetical protein [Actinomadura rupiterrae]